MKKGSSLELSTQKSNSSKEQVKLWKFRCAATVGNEKCLIRFYEQLNFLGETELILEKFQINSAQPSSKNISSSELKRLGVTADFKASSNYLLKKISTSLCEKVFPTDASILNEQEDTMDVHKETAYIGGHKLQGRLILVSAKVVYPVSSNKVSPAEQLELFLLQPSTGTVHRKTISKQEFHRLQLGERPSQSELKMLFNQVELPAKARECPSLPIGKFEKFQSTKNWPNWCKGKAVIYGGVFQLEGITLPLSVYLKGTQLAVVGLEPASNKALCLEMDLKQDVLKSAGQVALRNAFLDPTGDRAERKKAAKQLCKLLSLQKTTNQAPVLILPKDSVLRKQGSTELFTPRSCKDNTKKSALPAEEDEVSVAHTEGTMTCASTMCTLGRALKKKAMKISGKFAVARVFEVDGITKVRAYFQRTDQMLECTAPVERGLEPLEDFCDQVLKSLVLNDAGTLVSLREAFDDCDANYCDYPENRRPSLRMKKLPQVEEENEMGNHMDYLEQVKKRVRELSELAQLQVEQAVKAAETGLEYAICHRTQASQTSPSLFVVPEEEEAFHPLEATRKPLERSASTPVERAETMRAHGPLRRVVAQELSGNFVCDCLTLAMESAADRLESICQKQVAAQRYLQHQAARALAASELTNAAHEAQKAQAAGAESEATQPPSRCMADAQKTTHKKLSFVLPEERLSVDSFDLDLTEVAKRQILEQKSSRLDNSGTTNRILDIQFNSPDDFELTKFPWEHPTNQEFELDALSSPTTILGGSNSSAFGGKTNQMPSLDEVLSSDAFETAPALSPGSRMTQLRRWSQKRKQLQLQKHQEQLAQINPLNHSLYSSHTMSTTQDFQKRPSTSDGQLTVEAQLEVSKSTPQLPEASSPVSRRSSMGVLSKAASASSLPIRRQSARHSGSSSVIEEVRNAAAGAEGWVDRHSSLDAFKRLGYGNGKSKYLSYWRKRLSKSKQYYTDQFHMFKSVSELRKAYKTCSNEEAFCALAESRGIVGEAYSQLCSQEFYNEVHLVCKVLNVKDYMVMKPGDGKSDAPETNQHKPSAKELPAVVLTPGSSRHGPRADLLEGLVSQQLTRKPKVNAPSFHSKKDLLEGLPNVMKKHHLRAAQLKSVERLSTPQYRSMQKHHRGAMVRDEVGSVDLSTQSIELIDELAELRHRAAPHIV